TAEAHAFGDLVVHLLDGGIHLALRFAQRLAVLARDDGRDLVAPRDHLPERGLQVSLARERRERSPGRERGLGSLDRSVDILRSGIGVGARDLPQVGGVTLLEATTAGSRAPLAADEIAPVEHAHAVPPYSLDCAELC